MKPIKGNQSSPKKVQPKLKKEESKPPQGDTSPRAKEEKLSNASSEPLVKKSIEHVDFNKTATEKLFALMQDPSSTFDAVKELIEVKRADPNGKDDNGCPIAVVAISLGKFKEAALLLDLGATLAQEIPPEVGAILVTVGIARSGLSPECDVVIEQIGADFTIPPKPQRDDIITILVEQRQKAGDESEPLEEILYLLRLTNRPNCTLYAPSDMDVTLLEYCLIKGWSATTDFLNIRTDVPAPRLDRIEQYLKDGLRDCMKNSFPTPSYLELLQSLNFDFKVPIDQGLTLIDYIQDRRDTMTLRTTFRSGIFSPQDRTRSGQLLITLLPESDRAEFSTPGIDEALNQDTLTLKQHFINSLSAPKIDKTPTAAEFKVAVKAFKQKFNLKSIKQAVRIGGPLRHAFFADPIISAYMTRKDFRVDEYKNPIYEVKYEKSVYKADSSVLFRSTPLPPEAELKKYSSIPSREKFEQFYTQGMSTEQMRDHLVLPARAFLGLQQSMNPVKFNMIDIVPGLLDMKGIGASFAKLESDASFQADCVKDTNPCSHMLVPLYSTSHVSLVVAIFDNKKAKLKKLVMVNSWDDPSWNRKQCNLLFSNLGRKVPVLNCNLHLQINEGDGNCSMYSMEFLDAMKQVLVRNHNDIRSAIEADVESTELVEQLKMMLMLKLPQFYGRVREGENIRLVTKPYKQLQGFFLQKRWEIGRLQLVECTKAAKAFAEKYTK